MVFDWLKGGWCVLVFLSLVSCGLCSGDQWMLGDWDGKRSELAADGVEFEFVLTLEGIRNMSGGKTTGWCRLSNLDLIMDVNGEALGLSEESDLHVYLLGNYGDDPSNMIGDLQASSNIEAADTFKLYEIWWREHFWGGKGSVLVGMHDYNSVFNSLETAGLFTNSSFGISPDISQVGPSIFPTTSMALLLSLYPTENTYVHLGAYDGVPGDPGNHRWTQVVMHNDDGLFYAVEAGLQNEETGSKVGVGGWYQTTDFETDFDGKRYNNNSGCYLIGERNLNEKLAGFFQLGMADKNRNQIDLYVGLGVNYSGIFYDDDVFGVGLAYAHGGETFGDAERDADNYEMAVEFTYEFHPNEWLTLQPGLQIIRNPGMDPDMDDAIVFGVRAYITF